MPARRNLRTQPIAITKRTERYLPYVAHCRAASKPDKLVRRAEALSATDAMEDKASKAAIDDAIIRRKRWQAGFNSKFLGAGLQRTPHTLIITRSGVANDESRRCRREPRT